MSDPIWPKGTPGSDEAVKNGCTCSREKNRDGSGSWELDGETYYDLVLSCPVHGSRLLMQALEGEADDQ